MSGLSIVWLIMFLSELTNLGSILLSLLFHKKLSFPSKVITVHILLLFTANLSSSFLSYNRINNYFVLHLLTFFDLIIVTYFYSCVIGLTREKKVLLAILLSFGLIFCFMESFVFSTPKVANVYSIVLAGLIKILLIAGYFVSFLFKMRIGNSGVLDSNPTFSGKVAMNEFAPDEYAYWNIFSSSLLIYTASSMLFFLFINILSKQGLLIPFMLANIGAYAISTLMLLYGLYRYISK